MKRKIKFALAIICCLFIETAILAVGVDGLENSSKTVEFTNFSDGYSFSASALYGWIITSAGVSGGTSGSWDYVTSEGDKEFPCGSVTATGIRATGRSSTELFLATLDGGIKPLWGGGQYRTYRYTVTANLLESIAMDQQYSIVPLGGNSNCKLYNTYFGAGSPISGYWTTIPNTLGEGGTTDDTLYGAYQYYGGITSDPGYFAIIGAAHQDGGDKAEKELTVVEVASLLATYGTAPDTTTASSTTNNPQISETLIIPKGKSATIEATPNPSGSWPTYMAGDPPTAHSYPTWSVTGVTNPSTVLTSLDGPNTSIKSTVGSGTYKIVASCGTSTKAINITVIQITHNSTDVTEGSGTSKSVVVGEPNNLVVSGATFSSVSWTIPGSHIKSWDIANDKTTSSTQDLSATDLSTANLPIYYWYKSGTNLIPSVTVTIGTQQTGTKSATIKTKPFTVAKPNITVTTTTGTIAVDQNYLLNPGVWYIHYGSPSDLGGVDGIHFSHPEINTAPFGLTQWVQLMTGLRRRQLSSNNSWERVEGPGLDVTYPYSGLNTAKDSPGISLPSTLSQVIVSDSFQMYLMFKPITTGSIWVPIKVTSWGWSGTATRSGTNWTLSGGSKTTPSTSDASGYPTWDKIINPNNWTPEN